MDRETGTSLPLTAPLHWLLQGPQAFLAPSTVSPCDVNDSPCCTSPQQCTDLGHSCVNLSVAPSLTGVPAFPPHPSYPFSAQVPVIVLKLRTLCLS